MGGEADLINVGFPRRLGRSPRGRGSPLLDRTEIAGRGSIPAWAEKPHGGRRDEIASRVDPRVGGEATAIVPTVSTKEGRSPRGRGSLEQPIAAAEDKGSIPAWAGKPRTRRRAGQIRRVDPRVGGEASPTSSAKDGSRGRSPRGRGSLCQSPERLSGRGVDPRVGGEARECPCRAGRHRGRSPRGRGSPRSCASAASRRRSIPAWAGKPHRLSDGTG